MRILGIIASDGNAGHYGQMALRLKEALVETRKYWREHSEPQINWSAQEMHTRTDLAKLAEKARAADGILFAMYAGQQHPVENFLDMMADSAPFHDGTLRGKWVGFIQVGPKTSLGLEVSVGRLLAKANRSGLVPVPQSFAAIAGRRAKEHLRLAQDIAKALSTQSDWKGLSVWKEAA